MKVLICGNGNLTVRDGEAFLHGEMARFMAECCRCGMSVGYATIVLEEKLEKTRNLANSKMPDGVTVEGFAAFSTLSAVRKLLMLPGLLLKLFRIVREYDFFYCYYPGTISGCVIKAARLMRKKYALYVRGELVDSPAVQRDIRGAAFVFATGTTIVKGICPDYGRCQEVAPMSDVFRRECPASPRTAFRQPLRGLFVGRVSREKGIFELLAAMKVMKDRQVPVTMNLVGACSSDVTAAAREMGLGDCVIFSGLTRNEEELHRHYQEADFFCLPTWTEGFPRVLYEAMSHALPCLTTMVGGIPSRMQDGKNCYALKVREADSIVAAMTRLAESPAEMARLSEASLQTFRHWEAKFEGRSHAGQLYAELENLDKGK
ncbi:MAG: glycosyltransferase [Lentisphaeria bacterium]|nr:glycosyltransferase [Lentisphaeria bacterium]